MKYKIIDNFLDDSNYDQLVNNIMPPGYTPRTEGVHWEFLNGSVVGVDEPEAHKKITDIKKLEPINDLFLSHTFFFGGMPKSPSLDILNALLNKIDPVAIWRIQANLSIQQKEKRRTLFHIDTNQKLKQGIMNTSIFYVNTTNGPTILEDGTEIECRANRLVTYPYDTFHAAVLCTDQPYRVVINFNYFI